MAVKSQIVMEQSSTGGGGLNMVGDEECLSDRKWWCFLLSSIFTFIMGIFSVLVVRAFASLFCRKVHNAYLNDYKSKFSMLKQCLCAIMVEMFCNIPPN